MGKPGPHAKKLKALLDKYDEDQETAEVLKTARELGAAAKAGDEEKVAELSDKVKKKGWLK